MPEPKRGPSILQGGADHQPRVAKARYSTSTRTSDERLVPWLAAHGPLAYTPEAPPARDGLFQYGWVLPQVLQPGLRKHFYFGACSKDRALDLFAFWEDARRGQVDRVTVRTGGLANGGLEAPIAVYRCNTPRRPDHYLVIQHGSYQWIPIRDQPELEAGHVLLHRGIGTAPIFHFPCELRGGGDPRARTEWAKYVRLQFEILSCSALSFNSIHDRARRAETGHIRDGTWLTDDLAAERGLNIERDPWMQALWRAAHQSFALRSWVSTNKFGPNRVVCRTPLSNIRITTFFAGEHELRIVDPYRVEFVEAVGCRVERGP